MPLTITWRRAPVAKAPAQVIAVEPETRERVIRNQREIDEILSLYDEGHTTCVISKRVGRSDSFCKSIRRGHRPSQARNRVLTPSEAEQIAERLRVVPVVEVQSETKRGWLTLLNLARESDGEYKSQRRGAPISRDERTHIIHLLKTQPVRTVQRETGRSYDTLRKIAGVWL